MDGIFTGMPIVKLQNTEINHTNLSALVSWRSRKECIHDPLYRSSMHLHHVTRRALSAVLAPPNGQIGFGGFLNLNVFLKLSSCYQKGTDVNLLYKDRPQKNNERKPGVVAHAFNSSTQEAEADGSL